MKKFLKWSAISVGVLVVIGFIAFLYLIPPFTMAPPEAFIEPEWQAAPKVDQVSNPAPGAIAERGRYLVLSIGCTGCHTSGGDKGPKFDTEYLAGGMKLAYPGYGTVVSRNLTPDAKTGLGRRSDAQVMRTLHSGVSADDGRVFNPYLMPWAEFSNLTDEDRYAMVAYLRLLQPVYHRIPDFAPSSAQQNFEIHGLDYGIHESGK